MTYVFNEFQTKWLQALESDKYKQGKGVLFNGKGFCCIGVACDVAGLSFIHDDGLYYTQGEAGSAPLTVEQGLMLRGSNGDFLDEAEFQVGSLKAKSLTSANDRGATFSEIAAFIRSNPTAVFKE